MDGDAKRRGVPVNCLMMIYRYKREKKDRVVYVIYPLESFLSVRSGWCGDNPSVLLLLRCPASALGHYQPQAPSPGHHRSTDSSHNQHSHVLPPPSRAILRRRGRSAASRHDLLGRDARRASVSRPSVHAETTPKPLTRRRQYSDVIYKLLGFTAAMAAGPIGMYFLTVNSIFSGRMPT